MKTTIFKFAILSLMLVVLLGIVGCDKQETDLDLPQLCSCDFYSCASIEDFYKTIPSINEYLRSLPENWSAERKLQALVSELNAMPRIDAELGAVWTDRDCLIPCLPGTYGRIAILLDDNGLTRKLWLNIFGEDVNSLRVTSLSYIKPREVRVGLHHSGGNTTTNDVFDFINLFDRCVVRMWRLGAGRGYLSVMPADRVNYILNILNVKPYLSSVRVHHFGGYIDVCVDMKNMHNRRYQADWLDFMRRYSFFEGNTHQAWFIVDFQVPDGKEEEWIERFNSYEFVLWATRNYGFRGIEEIGY